MLYTVINIRKHPFDPYDSLKAARPLLRFLPAVDNLKDVQIGKQPSDVTFISNKISK